MNFNTGCGSGLANQFTDVDPDSNLSNEGAGPHSGSDSRCKQSYKNNIYGSGLLSLSISS